MKKTFLAILMALMLVVTAALPVAGADGLGDRLSHLKDTIKSAIGGKEESGSEYAVEKLVKKLVGMIEEKCRENGIDASQVLDQLLPMFTDENGKVDLSALTSLIGMFTSGGADSEEDPMAELDFSEGSYLGQVFRRDDMIREYVAEEYKDLLETGDVQIITMITVPHEEDELRYVLGYFSLANYRAEGKDLKFMNYAGNVEYLAFAGEDGANLTLAEAIPAEEGVNYSASVDALCEKYGRDRKDFDWDIDEMHKAWEETYRMVDFLEDHPEYERIEYMGEMKTLEEMQQIYDDYFDQVMEAAFAQAE